MPNPTEDEIANILSHVRYEIEQCFIVPSHHEHDWHLKESFFLAILIHARVLLELFESKERGRDDVLCSDFGFATNPVPISDPDRKRFNKDIAHLTYSRLRHNPTTKPWPVLEILRPLHERSVQFIRHVLANPPKGADAIEIAHWRELLRILTSGNT
jgi:hypothetical protein